MDTVVEQISKADKLQNNNKKHFWYDASKKQEALEIFKGVYTKLLIQRDYKRCAETAVKMAELYDYCDDRFYANDSYKKAADCYLKDGQIDKSAETYLYTISRFEEDGKLSSAARSCEELALVYHNNNKLKQAINIYKKSSDFYEADGRILNSLKLLKVVANIYIELGEFEEARNIYKKIISVPDASQNKLSFDDNLYMLSLCEFYLFSKCNNIKELELLLDTYVNISPSFETCREYSLINKCIGAFINGNIDDFTEALVNYDCVKKLSDTQVNVYNEIKNILLDECAQDIDLR